MSPLQLNTNIPPYHDDYDPLKNYYRVLYKGGYPVQARELTQSQTILQDQVEKLANRILATGDQVVGGEFGFTNKMPYVRVSSITQGSRPADFVGYTFVGQVSGVKAKVLYAYDQVSEGNEITEDVTFHVHYEDAGANSDAPTFTEGETLTSNHPDNYTAVVGINNISRPVDTQPMGFGSVFNIEDGHYFIDGVIVRNDRDSITLAKYSQTPTADVGFIVSETFVTSNQDSSLLDNSQGQSNFAAPGADRLQITLKLTHKLPETILPHFVTLAHVVQGNIQGRPEQSVKWDWLFDILAQRTFDESGDYMVRDFTIKRLEYVNSALNDGLFDADPETGLYPPVPGSTSDSPDLTLQEAQAKYVLEVSAGKAYVQGYECGYTDSIYLYGDKPRTPDITTNSFTHINSGAAFTLTNISGAPDLQNITGDGVAVAFTPIAMYKSFSDGYIGEATEEITYPDGTALQVPFNRNKAPLVTYHIIADGIIGNTQYEEVYNVRNSCVVVSPQELQRGNAIGGARILAVQKIEPNPSGFITPRYYDPSQVVDEGTGFESFATTYQLGILSSTFFTELACFYEEGEDTNIDTEWEVGSRIIGERSGAIGIIEEGTSKEVLIVSNIVGEFENGEPIEQPQTSKTATLVRPGEAIGIEFIDKGTSNSAMALENETSLEVEALGAKLTLTKDTDYLAEESKIVLLKSGRDKLLRFPYGLDNTTRTSVKVNLDVTSSPNGLTGYVIVLPAKISHTLQKTKSLFSALADGNVNVFAADIATQNATDTEIIAVADGGLFSGVQDSNFVTCDNFSGDPSEQLNAGDIVTLAGDDGSVITKMVKFVTTPAGSGLFRDRAYIYFTTTLQVNVTGKEVERLRIKTKGDINQGVVYRLPEQYVKSLETNPLKTGINYQAARQFFQNVEANSNSVTLSTNRSNEIFITNNKTSITISRNLSDGGDSKGYAGRLVDIASFDIQDNGRTIVIYFKEPLITSATLKIVQSVYVTDAIAKRKIIRRNVKKMVTYPESGQNIVSLGKADIFAVNYVKSISTGKDITRNYTLDDGQRANYYDIGRLILKPGLPGVRQSGEDNESGTIEIDFDYLEHQNDGDFFSVDSYTHEDGINYEQIPYYSFTTQGAASPNQQDSSVAEPLRDCIDFRPILNLTGDASVIASITPGVAAYDAINFRDSTNGGDGFAPRMPVNNSQFQADIEFYVGKIDTLFLDNTGRLVLQAGEQTENPIRPGELSTGLRLYDLRIQPFCINARDNITVKKYNYKRYRMKDIYSLDKRITRLEDVVSLTLLESKTLTMTVRDAVTGLDRFRTGYITDGFNDHSRGDVTSPYYRCAIDPKRSMLRPPFFKDQVDLEETYMTDEGRQANGDYFNNNGICTVPYAEVDYTNQPFATRWINLQVYNVFTWSGDCTLYPSIDTFTDIRQKPDLNIVDNSLWDAMTGMVDGLYELGVLGTVWESNHTLIDEYVAWGSAAHRNVQGRLNAMSDQFTQTNVSMNEVLPPRTVGSGAGVEVTTQIFGTHITATGDIQVERDMSVQGGQTVNTSYGDRITDMTLVTNMRTRPVFFVVSNVKPNTRFYAFFDGVDVNRWISPDANDMQTTDAQATCDVSNAGGNQKGFNQPIISDHRGVLTGVFLVPNGRPPLEQITQRTNDIDPEVIVNQTFDGYMENLQYEVGGPTRSFPTGQRMLRFTTEVNNRDADKEESDLVDSFAEAEFTASGIVADREKTVVSTRAVTGIGSSRTELQRVINEVQETRNFQRTFNRFQIRRDDPVAQSFEIDQNHPNGIFATELEVFFRTKDPVAAVQAYLIPTEGHVPDHKPIPMTTITKNPDTIIRVECQLNLRTELIPAGTNWVGEQSGCVATLKNDVMFESPDDNPDQNVNNFVYNVVFNNYYGGDFIEGERIIPQLDPGSDSIWNIVRDEVVVTRVDVTRFGKDYQQESTTVEFSQPELNGGVAATGTVKVSDGKVYDIVVTNPGKGYINTPSVSILSGGTGVEALATARIKPGTQAVEMGVAISEDGAAASGTRFKFEAPIYLLGNEVYCFVLYSTSLEYTAFTSRLGEDEIGTDTRVVIQPHLGSLYKSQNNGIWTEEQYEDIKFNLKKAEFVTNTNSKVFLQNTPLPIHVINRDPIETNSLPGTTGSKIFGDNPKIVTVYHDWHGLVSGDVVELRGVTGSPGGIDNDKFNKLHTVIDSDFQKFTIEVEDPAVDTEKSGGNLVYCTYNRPYESSTVKTGIIQAPNTSVTAVVRTVGTETVSGYNASGKYTRDTPVQVAPEQRFYHNGPKVVASQVNTAEFENTFKLRGEPPLKVTATLSTTDPDVSPVIDIDRTNFYVERNLVDRPDPEDQIYGLVPATVKFNASLPSGLEEQMDVEFTAEDGNNYKVRIDEWNTDTGRVQFSGRHTDKLSNQVTFANEFAGLPILRTSQRSRINFVPETKNFGSVFAKWQSNTFNLEEECNGVELRMSAVFYDVEDIKVYYKPRAVGFDGDFQDVNWIPFNPNQAKPGETRLDLSTQELVATPGLPDDVSEINLRSNAIASPEILKNSDLYELTWSFQDAAKFDAIAFKIVMTATNPAQCPLIDDIRVICSE